MRYLDPKNDLTFKRIFAEHPHLLKSFLNAVLPLPEGRKINSLEYLPAELVPEIPIFKNSIVDVRCYDNTGRQFIVEMQMLWTDSFKSRVLFNASKAYVKQVERGKEYKGLQPVYSLSIVNQNFDLTSQYFLHQYKLIHTENPESVMEGLEFVFVELPKFKAKQFKDKRLQVLWLRFLSEINDQQEEISPDFFEVPELKEASDLIRQSGLTKAQLETYDKYWDAVSTEKTFLVDAFDKGIEQGIEKGIEQGIEQGIELGAEQRSIEIAKKMIVSGMTSNEISNLTGLSIEQIDSLKRQK